MSARPVLTLVTTPPRGGQRAIEFIRWAVDTFGEPAKGAGLVVVDRTQTELVAKHDGISSGGTVSRYMRQLRAAGIVVGDRPITVDLHVLARGAVEPATIMEDSAASTLHADSEAPVDAARSAPAPSVAELMAQRAEQQARLAQLQAELALTDVAIARALSEPRPADVESPAREFASRALAKPRAIREIREPELANQDGRKGSLDHLPSFLTPDVATRARGTREPSRTSTQPGAGEPTLTYTEVDEILEPLRAWCRSAGRIDHLDDNGRSFLAPLGRNRLTAGVARIHSEADNDRDIRKPVGLLIDRARKHHTETFQAQADLELAPWATSPSPTSPPPDQGCRPTTGPVQPLFEPCVSHPLDDEAIALAASPGGLCTARRSLRTVHHPGTINDKETPS